MTVVADQTNFQETVGYGPVKSSADVAANSISDDALKNAQIKSLIFEYDFARLAGATGAKTLTSELGTAQVIPDDAIIVDCFVEGITSFTSGGSATAKVGYTGNDDAFLAAVAFDHGEYTADVVTIAETELPLKMSA